MGKAGARQLLNSTPSAEAAGPGRSQQHPPLDVYGRPLVEVFGMRTNFPVVGTIAVFDGTCGQIIYESDGRQGHAPSSSNSGDFTDLVLTGPHRAISADGGSFAVKVDVPGSDESDDDDGATELWECHIDDTDAVVESSITTDKGSIIVMCAMFSYAVEATVHVNLTATTTTHVYGKILAHVPRFRDEDNVVLFDRGADKMVELAPSTAGSVVPLARSVIAVPIGSPLVIIKVSLHAATTIAHVHEDTAVTFGGDLIFSLEEHTVGIHAPIGELSVSVNVTQ